MATRWPGLLLLPLALVLSAPALRALGPYPDRPSDRPSHRPIDDGLENDDSPEKRLAERLNSARWKKDKSNLDEKVRELAKKKLREDPEFFESLRKDLGPQEIALLEQALRDRRDLANDPALRKMVEESLRK